MLNCYTKTSLSQDETTLVPEWDQPSFYLIADCGLLSFANGQMDYTDGTLFGANGTVTCNEGYINAGPDFVECLNTGWSATPNCQIQGI